MVFKEYPKIQTKHINVQINLELWNSSLLFEDIERYVSQYFHGFNHRGFDSFVLEIMRTTKTSMWESGLIDVKELNFEPKTPKTRF